MDAPKLLPDGLLNPQWLGTLSYRDARTFVADLLHQRDIDFPAWVVSEPHDMLADAYGAAPEAGRAALRVAVADLVREVTSNHWHQWRASPEACDKLLLLAQEMQLTETSEAIVCAARGGDFIGVPCACGDMQGRLLQTMLTFGIKLPLEFWVDQARRNPRYTPVCMRGAMQSGCDPEQVRKAVDLPTDEAFAAELETAYELMERSHGEEDAMPPTDETDRMPEMLRALLDELTDITCGRRRGADLSHLKVLGLVESIGGHNLLTTAGQALWSLLNSADTIQSAERNIAAAGYTFTVEKTRGGRRPWIITIHHRQWPDRSACRQGETLALAMLEAREVAMSRKL